MLIWQLARVHVIFLAALLLAAIPIRATAEQAPVWVPEGPRPNGRGQVEHIADGEVTGAIKTIAAHPTDANVVFVGAVNGGIWKTSDGTAATPKWQQLTDNKESLSIGALSFDPTDFAHETLVAGTGRFSSLSGFGGGRTGLIRTTDGGATWASLDGSGSLRGLNISGVAPRGTAIVISVNDADRGTDVGVWRSSDTGINWKKVSGVAGTGLPDGRSAGIEGDPRASNVLFTNAGTTGIYRSRDAGETWTKVGDSRLDSAVAAADNIKIAIGHGNNIYVAIDISGSLAVVACSLDSGVNWTEMDLPSTPEGGLHAGHQGGIHLSLAADPNNPRLVYIGGDSQPPPGTGFRNPNSIGATDYSGRLFRGDSSKPRGSQWAHLTHSNKLGAPGGGTASNSAPHADSRDLAFAVDGVLLEVDDGGIYRRTTPQTNSGDWFSMNGDLQIAEFHAVAWDSNTHTIVGGAQDTGTPEQGSRSAAKWESVSTGDGGIVAVDVLSTKGRSVRYSSGYNLFRFHRQVYDSSGALLTEDDVALNPVGGMAPRWQFYTPMRLNAVNPQRLVIGAANALYESFDQGDTIQEIGSAVLVNGTGPNPIAYGAASNADVLYAGSLDHVLVRKSASSSVLEVSSAYPGGFVWGIAIDPANSDVAYVVAEARVFRTPDAGDHWQDITADLSTQGAGSLRSVAACATSSGTTLLLGGDSGVWMTSATPAVKWSRLGTGLPNAPVYHVECNQADGIILAGTLGRGAWTLKSSLIRNGTRAGTPPSRAIGALDPQRPNSSRNVSVVAASLNVQGVGRATQEPLELSSGIVVDPVTRRLYVMSVEGGIDALDLETGKRVWNSRSAAKPVGMAGGLVMGQVESSDGEANSLIVVALNPVTGSQLVSGRISLPSHVRATIVREPRGYLDVSASGSGTDAVVLWHFVPGGPNALPPGTKSILQGRSEIAPASTPLREVNAGAFRVNLASGAIMALDVTPPDVRATLSPLLTGAADRIPNIQNDQFLSADGQYVLTSKKTGNDTDPYKYLLTIYDRSLRRALGEFKSRHSVVPFFSDGSVVVYESLPYRERTNGQLVSWPREVKAINLKTGKELWAAAVRDAVYRGPLPP
jgi:hypothetical protein